MPKFWVLILLLSAVSARAATPVTIQQLQQILAAASSQTDNKLNKQLQYLELTERVSPALRARWEAELPGPASRQTFRVLADLSAFLNPPAAELPAMGRPSLDEQRAIIARSAAFAKKTIARLPDFYAARETMRFENTPGPSRNPTPMQLIDTSSDTILYRDGQEIVSLTAAERKQYGLATPGLDTTGVFGPMLGSVLSDTAQGSLFWSHWEQGSAGPLAIFGYKIPQAKSHYRVVLGLEYREHPAYHGEFAVDPKTGTILRLTIEADMDKTSPVVRSAVIVNYGVVTIADKSYICPLQSVTLNVFYPACTTREIGACGALAAVRGFSTQASLNDVTFLRYHVFRADTRILDAAGSPPQDEPAVAPDTVTASKGARIEEPATETAQSQHASAPAGPVASPSFYPGSLPRLSSLSAEEWPLPAIVLPAVAMPPHTSTPVFHITPGIVYLDVVVRDRNRRLVNGLTRSDFRVLENGHLQTIDSFQEVKQANAGPSLSAAPASGNSAASPLAGTSPETINLILFDLLDTAPPDQAYARSQMLKFLEALPPGQQIGLFVLTSKELRMVQSFTGNGVLLAAAARNLLSQSSMLFQSTNAQAHANDVTGSMPGLATPGGSDTSVLQDLAQDLAGENLQHGQIRNEFVTEAFHSLAKAVDGFQGRKNLYWLAGSFPLSERSEMLSASRIAVYPISVLGKQTTSINAEMDGNGVTAGALNSSEGARLSAQIDQRSAAQEDLRNGAEQIAALTGGEAFVDVNDLAGALRRGLADGENYYSLVYSPSDKNRDGKFRRIQVELAQRGYSLEYRRGYLALPAQPANAASQH